jgi:hypothetical protein
MPKTPEPSAMFTVDRMDLSHLRREARTALELAIVALAPVELTEHLAVAAGMLEAITEVPGVGGASAQALVAGTVDRARGALAAWHDWESSHLSKG